MEGSFIYSNIIRICKYLWKLCFYYFKNIDIHNIIIETVANKTTLVIYIQSKKADNGN